ncbi:MAG: hypothetical protein C5B46_02750 [Proteobacteria bacterium]|nr:MAG: hypothetical protein C5B46_02750 [Pseudomonadota bacterium]
MPSWPELSKRERATLVAAIALVAVLPLLPPIEQDQSYHHFADTRSWLGIRNAADVLSNLAFLAAGVVGLARLPSSRLALPEATRRALWVFFTGLILTGLGSGWYHLGPGDRSLLWDRMGMTVSFAGVLAAIISQRVSERLATPMLYVLLAAGLGSVLYWAESGSLSAYALIQFGGMLALLGLLLLAREPRDVLPWGQVLIWYGLAKIFESGDRLIWSWSNGLFAGHAIKHLAAAGAGFALAHALTAPKTSLFRAARHANGSTNIPPSRTAE